MSLGVLGPAEKAKLKLLMRDGVQTLSDIATMKEGLKESVAKISEELELEKKYLQKAIRVAYKLSENRDEVTEGRELLDIVDEILIASEVSK